MKRTRRYIFNTLTVVSLLLLLATLGLWVDSYWAESTAGFYRNGSSLLDNELWSYYGREVISVNGQISFRKGGFAFGPAGRDGFHMNRGSEVEVAVSTTRSWRLGGFQYESLQIFWRIYIIFFKI